jgi:hypothetical protein
VKDEQDQKNKIDEMKIIREVNIQAEAFYAEAKKLGDHSADAFGEKHRSQITGLENVAETALKTSDIFDYIKRKIICAHLEISDKTYEEKQERRRIHLLLIRQFIRQMTVEYEFQVSFGKGARRDGTH